MDEMNFKKWLNDQGVSKKMQSDFISRIKRIERETLTYDIDEQYQIDKCAYLLSLFKNKGLNENMNNLGAINLPIGKYELGVYKFSIVRYIKFIENKFQK